MANEQLLPLSLAENCLLGVGEITGSFYFTGKRLRLPAEIAALEARIEALEKGTHSPKPARQKTVPHVVLANEQIVPLSLAETCLFNIGETTGSIYYIGKKLPSPEEADALEARLKALEKPAHSPKPPSQRTASQLSSARTLDP